jgi:hypothetical protein
MDANKNTEPAATKTKQNKKTDQRVFSSVVAFVSNDLMPNNDLHPANKRENSRVSDAGVDSRLVKMLWGPEPYKEN